jgi:ribosome maturation factor RimP
MKEDLIRETGNKLDELNVYIYDVYEEKEGKDKYLRVVIDSDNMIDIDKVVKATKIIDPIIEKMDLVEGEYILDVYAKSKGDE